MHIDTLPDEAVFVFFAEALPEDGLHGVAIAVEGMDAPIPTTMLTVTRPTFPACASIWGARGVAVCRPSNRTGRAAAHTARRG